MAMIGKIPIFVESESPSYGVTVTENPVETGEAMADHVKRKLTSLSLRGRLIGEDAAQRRERLLQHMKNGDTLKYVGRNTFTNCIIESFSSTHDNRVANGMVFDMTIREIRKAKQLFPKGLSGKMAAKVKTKTTSGRKQTQDSKKKKRGSGSGKSGSGNQKTSSATADGKVKTHTVRQGQTWVSIAAAYGMSATKLRAANPQIAKYVRLKQGDILTIP